MSGASTSAIRAAFDADGFEVVRIVERKGSRGMLATSRTAENAGTGKKKRAFYLEGDAYTQGWLMGRLAEGQVSDMAVNYVVNVIPGLIDQKVTDGGKLRFLVQWFVDLLHAWDKKMAPDIPDELLQELKGLVDGCREANPHTKVDYDNLFTLNFGFDFLLAYFYAPNEVIKAAGIDPNDLKPLIACNGFAAWGDATTDGSFYFGRDFMFPSADVFQYCASMTVVVPDIGKAYLSMGAPGYVGSITAMNQEGIAAGVQMVPGGNVDHKRPGFNALGLVRWAIQHADSARDVVKIMRKAPRGVSWIYPVADAKHGTSVVIEAGRSGDLDPTSFPPDFLKGLLPDAEKLKADPAVLKDGLVARWHDYAYPRDAFMPYNPVIFGRLHKEWKPRLFKQHGTPGDNVNGTDFPKSYFFSPQLTGKPHMQVACNTYITPKMRMCSMDPWTVAVADDQWNDLQWRYDALTWLVRTHHGTMDKAKARDIADFLAPDGIYPNYYRWLWPDGADWRTQRIDGCVSLCDLTKLTMTSHWGNYGDDWVEMALGHYLA